MRVLHIAVMHLLAVDSTRGALTATETRHADWQWYVTQHTHGLKEKKKKKTQLERETSNGLD